MTGEAYQQLSSQKMIFHWILFHSIIIDVYTKARQKKEDEREIFRAPLL